ncbi:MAG: quinone-dependent dihydroorotate dehydrogenase [Hyphomicrobiaceae bacterium]
MLNRLYDLARPLVMALDPERAHETSLRLLEIGVHGRQSGPDDAILGQTIWGQNFPNPIGIAAGYDKDARVPDALLAMGMGFAEIGTVTPRAQAGNPKPRVFRLPDHGGVINRLGFNNAGHAAALRRLKARAGSGGIVGVNIGANKDSQDRAADYVGGIETFDPLASYFTVNVSSPNTPGLRDLQAPELLGELLDRVLEARDRCADLDGDKTPVIVKLAPDVAPDDLPAIVQCLIDRNIDGICVSNTTLTRPGLTGNATADETGGLSGAPLFPLATAMLARVCQLTEGKIPLIGVGGVNSGAAAVAKMEAGASLIQLYTGLIYGGPALIGEMKSALADEVRRHRLSGVGDLVGRKADAWSASWGMS